MQIAQLSPRFFVAGQIHVDQLEALADHGIRSIVNNRPDDEDIGQPKSADIAAAASELGLAYAHVPVESGWITQQDVDDFSRACAGLEGPILLFCRSGTRCMALWQLSEQQADI